MLLCRDFGRFTGAFQPSECVVLEHKLWHTFQKSGTLTSVGMHLWWASHAWSQALMTADNN